MTIDEYIALPCRYCGKVRSQHVGRALVCFGGVGTLWNPAQSMLDDLNAPASEAKKVPDAS